MVAHNFVCGIKREAKEEKKSERTKTDKVALYLTHKDSYSFWIAIGKLMKVNYLYTRVVDEVHTHLNLCNVQTV